MADTWQTAKTELEDLLDDAVFDSGGTDNSKLLTWANRIVKDICLEIDIRDHLQTKDVTLYDTAWDYDLRACTSTDDFLKVSRRFTRFKHDDSYVEIVGKDTLEEYDPDHDDTGTGDCTVVSIEGTHLYTYPMTTSTGTIENYLREPTDMTATDSTVDLPWIYYVSDLIVAGVAGKYGFPYLNEYEQAAYYEGRYNNLLEKYRLHVGKSNSIKKLESIYY